MVVAIENEGLLRQHLASGDFTLFAGAGFSTAAKGELGPLPVGAKFADSIRSRFNVDPGCALTLPQIYTIADRNHPSELRELIESTFTVTQFDPRYRFLRNVPPSAIVTTNVDDLFQKIFEGHDQRYLNDVFLAGTANIGRSAIDLVQVHGSVRDRSRDMVFGPFDLAAAAATDPDRWRFVASLISRVPTLFWGYGFADSGTLQAMRASTPARPVVGDAWVQLRSDDDQGLSEFYRSLDFNVIVGSTDELLDYFVSSPIERSTASIRSGGRGNIPASSEVPTRPTEDFFAGAAPVWSDIWGGNLYRTAHYRTVAESIAKGNDVVLAGIPGCGKTTLLMQLAAHMNSHHDVRLFYENLGLAEAQMVRAQLRNKTALVVLDNVASDVRVVEALAESPGVQILAADRDFTINSVSDRLARLGIEVLGVTGQSRADRVSVWRSIPQRIRRNHFEDVTVPEGASLSLYEVVRANVRSESLSDRLLDYLKEISNSDPELAELLLLACYLMYSRSLLSSDVALAYFRGTDVSYDDVIDMIDSVGEMLLEASTSADDQDYFTARSALVAEEILERAPAAMLREVLTRFHENVTSLRIHRFDVFRRRGYDARIVGHAFRSPDEAADFYEAIMEKDPSPFVLQQKALFLSQRGRHDDAFRAAEEARSLWRGKPNWTIESTYYKVLFYANVAIAQTDPAATALCSRALDGLGTCYARDRRRGQHSLIFADCALKYEELEGVLQNDARQRLEHARQMLAEVSLAEPYMQRPKYLKKLVDRRIAKLT